MTNYCCESPVKIFCDHTVITNHARDHGCDHSFHRDHGDEKTRWEWSHLWSRLRHSSHRDHRYQKCYVLELFAWVKKTNCHENKNDKIVQIKHWLLSSETTSIYSDYWPQPLICKTTSSFAELIPAISDSVVPCTHWT